MCVGIGNLNAFMRPYRERAETQKPRDRFRERLCARFSCTPVYTGAHETSHSIFGMNQGYRWGDGVT